MIVIYERVKRHAAPLLLLAAAMVGFFLLINIIGPQASSGPDDFLAPIPSDDKFISLPSGAGIFSFILGTASVVLALVFLAARRRWMPGDSSPIGPRFFAIGVVAALVLGGAGLYFSFAGTFTQGLPYDQHQAQRAFIEPKGLAVLVAFFLSLAAVGIFRPGLLGFLLALWLVLGIVFGFFGSASLAGLKLFNWPSEIETSDAYAAEVEKYRAPKTQLQVIQDYSWDARVPLENGNEALIRDQLIFLVPGTTSAPDASGLHNKLFTVTGAAHTTFLRTATGDIYGNGKWTQLDPVELQTDSSADIPRSVQELLEGGPAQAGSAGREPGAPLPQNRRNAELLSQPYSSAPTVHIDLVSVTPAANLKIFHAGVLPMTALPLDVGVDGLWRPFSRTFQSNEPLERYEWRALSAEFPEGELVKAAAVGDPTYYQLPQETPQRVKQLSRDITRGLESPYEKAKAIEVYLKAGYSVFEQKAGMAPFTAMPGADPVDWFLFDHPSGGATAFSSAFVVLARSAGVPARLVSGWAIEPVAEEQVVTGKHAHQWAEIALEGYGWITFDPTPSSRSAVGLKAASPGEDDGQPVASDIARRLDGEEGVDGTEGDDSPVASPWEAIALENLALSTDQEIRSEAALLLGWLGGLPALEGLAGAIQFDENDAVREASYVALSQLDFGLLVDVLLNHEDGLLRTAAAAGLGEKGDPRALTPLAAALFNDADPEVRSAVAEALGDLDITGGVAPLSRALSEDPDPDEGVRAAAAAALGEIANRQSLDPLVEALSSDSDNTVREAAATALGEMEGEGAAEQLLQSLEDDPNAGVRTAAAESLGQVRNVESLPELVESRDNDESPDVRSAAADALDRFPVFRLSEAIRSSGSQEVRAEAANLLGEREQPAGAPALIEALSDEYEEVREAASEALENLGTTTRLENGSGLLSHSAGVSFVPGTSAFQASELPHIPVFEVQGADGIDFLRTAVGDRYEGGYWYSDAQTRFEYRTPSYLPDFYPPAQRTLASHAGFAPTLSVLPAGDETWIPEGTIPTSYQLETLSLPGTYFTGSMTFSSDHRVASYNWTSSVIAYSAEQLNTAAVSLAYGHRSLPEGVPARVGDLAKRIVAGQSSPYLQAKAIENHLRANYTYRLADPVEGGLPQGHDPVDWFLFESREGTCGNFSSAFVMLARSVGLTARVISGWSIAPTGDGQVVYGDQAHQRAEVAFEGLGWIAFEPTASGGPPDRAPQYSQEGGSEAQFEREQMEALAEELSSADVETRREATEALEHMEADVAQTESGGSVVTREGRFVAMMAGTTTAQATKPDPIPVFSVAGAANTSYLRTTVGDVYQQGMWNRTDPVSIAYEANQSIPHLVKSEAASGNGPFASLPASRVNSGLLTGYETVPDITLTDTILVEAFAESGKIPAGAVPTSKFLDSVDAQGDFRPFSGTFSLESPVDAYTWVSQIPLFSTTQRAAAEAAADPTYTELPDSVPQRIRTLAQEVVGGHDSVYARAKALEAYLKSEYTYAFADGSGAEAPPPGRDPVDWFLFDHREGTCGVFSSAFVVMARSVGIPARVVSGWAISRTESRQVVRLDQAHQWAEVALGGLGWVAFEPTAAGSALSRVPFPPQESPDTEQEESLPDPMEGEEESTPESDEGTEFPPVRLGPAADDLDETEEVETPILTEVQEQPRGPVPPPEPMATVTTISLWPSEVRRKAEFAVGGTVRHANGRLLSGDVEVEIFINETKDHGGTKIGHTTARNGTYKAEVRLPSSMERGAYQLLAHTIGNEQYEESWSDPDITVYSESGLQLTGPGEVAVDTQALFRGKFLDDTGAGVEDRRLQVSIDERPLPPQTTGPSGEFSFVQTFTEIGPHRVEVAFEDQDFLTGNSVALDFTAVMPTVLTIEPIGKVRVRENFAIRGTLRNARKEPLAGKAVTIRVADDNGFTATTDDLGHYTAEGSVGAIDEFEVHVQFDADYPVLPSKASSRVVTQHPTMLALSGPGTIRQGESATFRGTLSSETLPDIGAQRLIVMDEDGNELSSIETSESGSFEYSTGALHESGPYSWMVSFSEKERFTGSSSLVSFAVVSPTVLTVEGSEMVESGETLEVKGTLKKSGGDPVGGASIWIGDPGAPPLLTGDDGSFSHEFPVEAQLDDADVETTVSITIGFEGNDHLAPSLGSHTVAIGVPWLSVEPLEAVARAETTTLRGTVFLGSRPLSGAVVEMQNGLRTVTDDTGNFALGYSVPSGTPLGRNEIAVSAPGFDLRTIVPIDVTSNVHLVVLPLDDVRPGQEAVLQAALYDDSGDGIPGATLLTGGASDAVTDDEGIALITLNVPHDDTSTLVPVTIQYEGDAHYQPLTYFIGLPITTSGFNRILWVGMPVLLIALLTFGYAAGRLMTHAPPAAESVAVPTREPRGELQVGAADVEGMEETTEPEAEPEPVPDPEATVLTVEFDRPAHDLPDVWGVGEPVAAHISLSVAGGLGVAQYDIGVRDPDGNPLVLATDDDGVCVLEWTAERQGEFRVSARFAGDDNYLESSDSRNFRVVDFREEVVRLYNSFVEWAGQRISGGHGTTPRELESLVVASGLTVSYRALDEIITRFEEADYSEHEIERRQYESMYRSWNSVVGQ